MDIGRFRISCVFDGPIRAHGDESASRDYILVEDLCTAIDLAVYDNAEKAKGGVFNVASGFHHTMLSIAKDIMKIMRKDESLLTFVEDRPGQVIRHTCVK